MATDIHADTEEMAHLTELMKEYTGKLRAACDTLLRDRMLLLIGKTTVGLAVASFCIGVVLIYAIFGDLSSLIRSAPLLAIGAIMGIFFAPVIAVVIVSYRYRRLKQQDDATHIYEAVARLVTRGSQYNEHASHLIDDKFTFRLRLIEAEAVLVAYQTLTSS